MSIRGVISVLRPTLPIFDRLFPSPYRLPPRRRSHPPYEKDGLRQTENRAGHPTDSLARSAISGSRQPGWTPAPTRRI